MTTKSKVPQIRFRGFSGEWKESELGKKVEFFTGLTYSPHNVIKDNGTLVLRSSNVKNGQIIDADNVYVNSNVVNCSNVLKGDIVVVVRNGSRSLIGKHAQIQKEMNNTVIGAFMTGIRSEQPSFINALLDSPKFYKEIEKNLGATINQITTGAFKKMTFSFPKQDEQIKIGNYFQQLDNLIEQKEKKYQKIKQFKKAMLDKIFPKNGADTPEIRFKGFSGKWEERKLGDIFNYERPDNYIVKSTEYSNENKTPVLTANKAFILGYTNESNTFDKPSIIFDDFTLDFKFVDFPYMVKSSALKILTINDEKKDSLIFIYNLLHTIKIEIMGHARHYIGVVQPTNVFVPKIEEQEKIGNYFQKLDNQIDLQQKELEKLKNIKKASLAKMFV